jgi:hypothetical protein
MTLQQLLHNTTSEELGLWIALQREEAEEQRKQSIVARAEASLAKKRQR